MALTPHFWHLLTRLGEMQILLPAALLVSVPMLGVTGLHNFLLRWWLAIVLAAAITTATKLAFIGWGVGIAALNFTGISGHAMFAAATHPLLCAVLASKLSSALLSPGWF